MQNSDESSPSSSHRRRGHLPPLAPRNSQTSSRGDRSSSSSGRPPRLSHRSRAGCWTCRGRKVKCDEIHPICGPCTRLNRDCDWDHRWNFSDATPNTQSRYTNVTTQGNSVWDPSARSSPSNSPTPRYDDMPAFSVLQTDDERERKAKTQRPGTFGVVVTPESFSDLPEYSAAVSPNSRRMSTQSTSSLARRTPSTRRRSIQYDPNTVVLDRFEDASPGSGNPFALPPPDRRPSLPESMYYLAITTPPSATTQALASLSAQQSAPNYELIARFRQYIVQRLCQPLTPDTSTAELFPGCTKDTFEIEAQRFPPLHHAICAISSLNLSYGGNSTLEAAMSHYSSALSADTAQGDILLSDGGLLRHFLLLVYDICMPMNDDSSMWAEHLNHLKRIMLARHQQKGPEPRGYIIWRVCELDTYACLMGNGTGEFIQHVVQNGMLPPLEQQIPTGNPAAPHAPNETAAMFRAILTLRLNVMICTARLAQLAQNLRSEAARIMSPGAYARRQDLITQMQSELSSSWLQSYPQSLLPESPEAGRRLPPRARHVFEQAYLLYHAAILYSRTSMYPCQRRRSHDDQADTERRVLAILAVASATLTARDMAARHVVFPLFMAGVATLQADAKVKAVELITAFEVGGIGTNTSRVRKLLKLVYEEQRQGYGPDANMVNVDWLGLARSTGCAVVNCGL